MEGAEWLLPGCTAALIESSGTFGAMQSEGLVPGGHLASQAQLFLWKADARAVLQALSVKKASCSVQELGFQLQACQGHFKIVQASLPSGQVSAAAAVQWQGTALGRGGASAPQGSYSGKTWPLPQGHPLR